MSLRAGYVWGLVSAALGATYFCTGSYLVKRVAGVGVREFTLALFAWATLYGFLATLVTPRSRQTLTVSEHRVLAVLGVLWGVQVALAFHAAQLLDPGSASTLFRTSALFTLALAYGVLGERLTGAQLGAASLVIAGLGTFLVGGSTGASRGAFVALASALVASIYQLAAKRALTSIPPGVLNVYRNAYVCVVFGLVAAAAGWRPREASWAAHAAIALAAFLGPFLHSIANLKSIQLLPLIQASLVSQTMPVLVLAIAYTFLGERPAPVELAGDALMLAGVVALIISGSSRPSREVASGPAGPSAAARVGDAVPVGGTDS